MRAALEIGSQRMGRTGPSVAIRVGEAACRPSAPGAPSNQMVERTVSIITSTTCSSPDAQGRSPDRPASRR